MPKPKKLTRTARLANKDLIHPPPWLPDNIMLEGLTGSFAYGCEDPKKADRDIVGIAIPPKTVIFPHLAGYIQGFGKQPPKFDQFQAHGIEAKDERKTYDITIYNIVKFFQLAVELYGFGGKRTEGANGRWVSSIAQRKCLSSRAFFRFFLHSERLLRPPYSKVHQTPVDLVQAPDSDH